MHNKIDKKPITQNQLNKIIDLLGDAAGEETKVNIVTRTGSNGNTSFQEAKAEMAYEMYIDAVKTLYNNDIPAEEMMVFEDAFRNKLPNSEEHYGSIQCHFNIEIDKILKKLNRDFSNNNSVEHSELTYTGYYTHVNRRGEYDQSYQEQAKFGAKSIWSLSTKIDIKTGNNTSFFTRVSQISFFNRQSLPHTLIGAAMVMFGVSTAFSGLSTAIGIVLALLGTIIIFAAAKYPSAEPGPNPRATSF